MASTRPAHRPSARDTILDAAEGYLREGGVLSLDSAAKAAGVTKAGVLYHFRTKEELMAALLDHLMARYEVDLQQRLVTGEADIVTGEADIASAEVRTRLRAYVDWACETPFDVTDLVMFTDPRLRESLTRRWTERLEPWLGVPREDPERARLLAARLMADGLWFDGASGTLALSRADKEGVREVARELIGPIT